MTENPPQTDSPTRRAFQRKVALLATVSTTGVFLYYEMASRQSAAAVTMASRAKSDGV
jgi:hypothetical protein